MSTCVTGVLVPSRQFSDFHMSELVFTLREQHVGALSISYCLGRDIIKANVKLAGWSSRLL